MKKATFLGHIIKQTWGKRNKTKRAGHNQLASTRSVVTGGMRVWTPTFVLDKFFNFSKRVEMWGGGGNKAENALEH